MGRKLLHFIIPICELSKFDIFDGHFRVSYTGNESGKWPKMAYFWPKMVKIGQNWAKNGHFLTIFLSKTSFFDQILSIHVKKIRKTLKFSIFRSNNAKKMGNFGPKIGNLGKKGQKMAIFGQNGKKIPKWPIWGARSGTGRPWKVEISKSYHQNVKKHAFCRKWDEIFQFFCIKLETNPQLGIISSFLMIVTSKFEILAYI